MHLAGEIIPDVEGLIHISQLSHDRVNNKQLKMQLKTGDEVNVKIIDINKDKKKSFS